MLLSEMITVAVFQDARIAQNARRDMCGQAFCCVFHFAGDTEHQALHQYRVAMRKAIGQKLDRALFDRVQLPIVFNLHLHIFHALL